MADNDTGTTIEFNSMVAVLKRLANITERINYFRNLGDRREAVACLMEYYKEIYPDLIKEENKIYERLKNLQKIVSSKSASKTNWWVIRNIDEIDMELRRLAKKHGYLTKNAKNVDTSMVEM